MKPCFLVYQFISISTKTNAKKCPKDISKGTKNIKYFIGRLKIVFFVIF